MLELVCRYFLTFIIISFFGWFMEEIFAIAISKEKVNRGFLIGPLCPIYGFASIIMIFALNPFKDNIIILFFISVLICALLEYITSYLLEKILKIKLWDYKDNEFKYSIHGRVALETLIPFGILGIIVIRFINPFISHILDLANIEAIYTISLVVFVIFCIDLMFSIKVILNMDKSSSGDITKKKNDKVKKELNEKADNVKTQIKKTNTTVKKHINKTKEFARKTIKKK